MQPGYHGKLFRSEALRPYLSISLPNICMYLNFTIYVKMMEPLFSDFSIFMNVNNISIRIIKYKFKKPVIII